MKKLMVFISLLLAVPAFAQNKTSFAGALSAWNFAYGINQSVPALVVDFPTTATTGGVSATFTVAYGQTTTADGITFSPLTTSSPVTIIDAGGADTATPSAVSCTTPGVLDTCQVTVTFAHAHAKGARLFTGSYGLQEAANYRFNNGGGLVVLGSDWFSNYSSHANAITALTGFKSFGTTVTVLDWSGIAGVFSYTAAGGSVYASTTHVLY